MLLLPHPWKCPLEALQYLMSFLNCGAPNCFQQLRRGHPRAEQSWTIPSLPPLAMLGLVSPGQGCPPWGHHIQLSTDQDPQVPFHGAALQHLIPQPVHTSRVAPSQVHSPALSLDELHWVGDCLALPFVLVSLQSLPSLHWERES